MYEPLILKKRKLRTITGTPAAKVSVILNFSKIIIPFAGLLYMSYHLCKRKIFIAELDEIDLFHKDFLQEFHETRKNWSSPEHQAIVTEVFRRQCEKEAQKANLSETS